MTFLASLLIDQFWVLLFIATLLIYLSWHVFNLARLSHRLASNKLLQHPYPSGLWRDLYEQIYILQIRKRKSKGKFTRFREVASALPDAVVILGQHGRIEWCNHRAQQMLGLYWPKSMGQPLTKLIKHPILDEYLARGKYHRSLEFPSPANKARMLSLRISRFGKHGDHHLLIARDITQIYHLNQTQQDFVANVSHELRTPLTVITGFLENMHYSQGVERRRWGRSIELMQSQASRMQGIINELLTLSRLLMTNQTQKPAPVFVSYLLASIVKEARMIGSASEHNITLAADPVVWLRGYSEELRSAFSNLIFNAIKHTPPRADIDIRWYTDDTGALLTVSDTGEGIATRHIPRLTERFYRIDPGRSRKSGGTGLGLAIVKYVLEHHNSELKIASKTGKGSTFSCHFPTEIVIIRDDSGNDTNADKPKH
ncbi:MAG: phosphate regulon sensor histidine kinase PhoR [Gammaproteobacteria bacterium]|nr:phosphate regulon sensor histidine kinase PhoR [Gammaproteobacteria bacterium]